MPVYIKKISKEWRTAFEVYEAISGFEMQYQEEVESGEITPRECWSQNIQWLELVLADCTNIQTPSD